MGGQETLLLLARHHTAARRRRRLRPGYRPFAPVQQLPTALLQPGLSENVERPGREDAAVACTAGDRRHSLEASCGVRGAKPGDLRADDRRLVRAARALVERARPDRPRPAAADRRILRAADPKLNPYAPIEGFQGFWNHSAEMRPQKRLPAALADFGLIPPVNRLSNVGLHIYPPVSLDPGCMKASASTSESGPVASAAPVVAASSAPTASSDESSDSSGSSGSGS